MPDVRLIDANALRKNLSSRYMNELYPDWRTLPELTRMRIEMLAKEFRFAIDHAPTIDAVPVVRCRECEKFWEYTESHKATVEKADGDCMIRCMVAPDDPQFCAVQKDDYCSMGKRKGAKMDGGAENGR